MLEIESRGIGTSNCIRQSSYVNLLNTSGVERQICNASQRCSGNGTHHQQSVESRSVLLADVKSVITIKAGKSIGTSGESECLSRSGGIYIIVGNSSCYRSIHFGTREGDNGSSSSKVVSSVVCTVTY